ncbi:TrmH family RNA methyltransferase [Spirochaeta isovalerica]|uniref:TrmH family RNA methyltransferase n=1 Tax=Spirochaeta isovalerica TaxID=150 RepID=A0A841RIM9_9SPIO|nr:TrmH family RNA methyltransferase [Spirochaeta isovalerica]MBB6482589.1 TrmH family RNA methyltransferase [Spirochaeta isovalerica]
MITLRKLASLKDDTRRRKFPLLLQGFEENLKSGGSINRVYLAGLADMILRDRFYEEKVHKACRSLISALETEGKEDTLLWSCNSLRYKLQSAVGAEPGDWDFLPSKNEAARSERVSGELYLYLDGVRSPFNVGSIFRSAESFGIKEIILSEETCSPDHRRAKRSSMGCTDILPWSYGKLDDLVHPLFALELGGTALESFPFPEKGTLIIGSEELGVSPASLDAADSSLGRVSIRTGGLKGSINVSVATGIALQKWFNTFTF